MAHHCDLHIKSIHMVLLMACSSSHMPHVPRHLIGCPHYGMRRTLYAVMRRSPRTPRTHNASAKSSRASEARPARLRLVASSSWSLIHERPNENRGESACFKSQQTCCESRRESSVTRRGDANSGRTRRGHDPRRVRPHPVCVSQPSPPQRGSAKPSCACHSHS